ncbi:hypothetical protein ACFVU3_36145 [Streptomyces sp. NPDC058052]|uniref:hypothetical protein n=1 Tax=Streptomyces sp. NPDC058052 TaxID=3346316 RepID=UPI0036E465BF
MDGFVGQARLEWWANHVTCLEKYDIDVIVTVDAVGTWWASGQHAHALGTTQREGWDFLMEMDPYFSLVLPGEEQGGVLVNVVEAEDGTLTLTKASDADGQAPH